MSKRGVARINYKELHTTGVVVPLVEEQLIQDLNNMTLNDEPGELEIDVRVILDEIRDIIDENPFANILIADVDETIQKLESLRSQLRRKSLQLGETDLPINDSLASIKEYIVSAKDFKSKLHLQEENSKQNQLTYHERSAYFSISNIERQIQELNDVFKNNPANATNDELLQWKSNQQLNLKKFEKIADDYKEVLKVPILDEDRMFTINSINDKLQKLSTMKQHYTKTLDSEIKQREPEKTKSFNKQHLNIKLDRFSGYESNVDFYTFKSNFEKIHLQSTPSKLLPDLLKNNFLSDPALTMVKSLDDIDNIWKQLEEAYGDTKIMLSRKLQQLSKLDAIRTTNSERLTTALGKVINMLNDVIKLANDHKIEEYLYYGDGLSRIYNVIGDRRTTSFLKSICDDDLTPKQTWAKLVTFLQREKKIQQQKALLHNLKPDVSSDGRKSTSSTAHPNQPSQTKRPPSVYNSELQSSTAICKICDASEGSFDHVSTAGPAGSKILQYFTCKRFVESSPSARFKMLRDKNYCLQCLFPGASATSGKHAEGRCQRDFVCSHQSHQNYPKKHFLVCEEHKHLNQHLLNKYIERFVIRNSSLPHFSRKLSLATNTTEIHKVSNHDCENRGIYLLQNIAIDDYQLLIFFDNGCSDFVITPKAVEMLGSRCIKESSDPIILGGVGNSQIHSTLGTYQVKLPLHNGRQAILSGVCVSQITSSMPHYPLEQVSLDIQESYRSSGGKSQLPQLPKSIGGQVHIMIGMKYLRYHPKMIHQLPSGLAIFESPFKDVNGHRGVVGGPHEAFTSIHHNHFIDKLDQQSSIHHIFRDDIVDVPLLGYHQDASIQYQDDCQSSFLSTTMKIFEEVEATGSEIAYRCPQCRSCKSCKHESSNEIISVKEEVEQSLINASVSIDLNTNNAHASLPFISDPLARLTNNKSKAMKVYQQQLRKLDAKDKQDILESEGKLQKLGYVEYIHNLSPDAQSKLQQAKIQYFIPWRAVWKGNSISTPCRIVFDASQATSSGYSLNDLLAKGRNNLNKLQEVLLRWCVHPVAIHTDVKKMYNTIKLEEKDWCYQRYLWHPNLEIGKDPEEKIIKTLIYGVRSSGNQAEYALRKVAEVSKVEFPDANEIIQHDIYVDDCLTGEINRDVAHQRADELEVVLNRGGFQLKGVAFSGEDPPDTLSEDGNMLHIAGLKWFVKSDEISLNIDKLNFAKKIRGRKPAQTTNIIPAKLTRRHCASKVAEVFDLTGKLSPIIASMKIDLQQLVHHNLNWDDVIPDNLRQLWESNFEMITEIGNLRFNRAVIPQDAVNMELSTLDFGDASTSMVCVAVYVRFLRHNGCYSCQLILARTRVVPKGFSQPRAELYAALINTHTGEVVKRSLKKWYRSSLKFTDSQIVLHWIDNDEKPMKQWVRNRVVEIHRHTSKDQWYYISTNNMIADIGTRRGAKLNDVGKDSVWINGMNWMKLEVSQFPIKNAQDLKLSDSDMIEVSKESQFQIHHVEPSQCSQIHEWHLFSNYLINPNHRSFTVVVRILAYVIKFCNKLKNKTLENTCYLSNDEIHAAEMYFYKKATAEVIKFLPSKKYEPITVLKDDVLHYNGRILPDNQVTIVGRFTNAMMDLSSQTFFVPVIHKNSPVAFSIVNDIHWNSKVKHSGVESTLREVLKKVFVIEGRSLVKFIKKQCLRCRYLDKRRLEAVMGPIPSSCLTIAPAFYNTQIDLSGPYKAFHPQHKRTTVKIWLVVYCCSSTSAVMINVMDDYSTTAFILSFTRFASRYGFPKEVYIDEGSQLVKGTQDMRLSFTDIKSRMYRDRKINFQTCPVGAHNVNGKVERKIKEVNNSLERTIHNERLSILQWETIAAVIANTINDLPLLVGNVTDIETMDLLTPNRLILGRNNDRSPTGNFTTCNDPTKIIKENSRIYDTWFETWLVCHVPKLMQQSKWFEQDKNLQIGDVVLFTKVDNLLSKKYTYGMVTEVHTGQDGNVRKVTVKYQNVNENVPRETIRSVRNLVLIHSVDDIDLAEWYELSKTD